ncbi:MAG: pre-peptidase C-terminal domain-containing protein [Myxococcales bacterium]|nr:pre-peptidase C-terminal domain-containing protein [Myxococcales bacterium]
MALNDTRRSPACTHLALFALVAALGYGCGADGNNSGSDAGNVDAGTDAEDTHVTIPTIEPKLTADIESGNVPLTVNFTLDLGENDAADFLIAWDFGDGDKLTLGADQDPNELLKVTHKFKYKGQFPTRATVTWKKNLKVTKTVTKEINVLRPSNITLSVVALLTPTEAFPGDTVKLSFDILSDGEAYKAPLETCIYLSSNDAVDADDLKVHTIKHPDGVKSGVNGTEKISYTKDNPVTFKLPQTVKDGNWFVIVKADCQDKAPELNKQDNEGFATSLIQIDTKVTLPSDLVITTPLFDNAQSVSPGQSVSYNLKLKNQGQGEGKNFSYGVFLSKDKTLNFDVEGPPADADLSEYLLKKNKDLELTDPSSSKVPELKPGVALPIFRSAAMPDVPDGKYYLIAKIDTKDTVSETNETNNIVVSDKQLTVKKVIVQGTNLKLVDMTVSPKSSYLGGTVAVNWHVKNDGTLPTPVFEATVYFCPTAALSTTTCVINKTHTTIPKLAVGQEKKGAVSIKINTGTPVQDWYIYLQIDPNKKVNELNEADNTKVWSKPPLKITATANIEIKPANVGYHPTSVKAGGVLKLSHKVINTGSTSSSQTTTYIVMSPNNNISWANRNQLIVVNKVTEPGVDGLDFGYRSTSFVVPKGLSHKVSKYYVGVILDPEMKETKDNHNDNALGATQVLQVTDTKGGCFQDAFDKKINNDTKGNSTVVTPGTYKNLGMCEDEEDWFAVDVSKGHSLFVTTASENILWTSPVPSDINIDIYGPDNKLLDSVKGLGALKKAVALTVAKGGKHYLRIYPHTPAVRAHFQLDIKVNPPPKGTDLFGNGLTAGPVSTFPGGLVKTKMQLTNVGATAAGPFKVSYVLSADSTITKADTTLKTVSVDKGLGGATSMNLAQNLVLPVVKGGKYYIGVLIDSEGKVTESDEANNAVTSNSIQLNPTISCATDAFTGNHTVEEAAQLQPITKKYDKLNVCPGLEDWFAVKLPVGKAFKAKVNWSQKKDAGIIGIQIVDASGTGVLAGSANPLKTEASLPYLQVGGTYYIHTYVLPIGSKPPQPYDYGLEVTVSEPDPSDVCLADVYESNNSHQTAQELGCGLANMTLCLGDEDWFYLDLAKDEQVKIKFTHEGAGFLFNLYSNPKLPPIQKINDKGTIDFKAPSAGKYYMQAVYKSPGKKPTGSFAYELKVDGGKGVDLLPTIKSLFPGQVIQGEDAYLTMNVSNECKDDAAEFHYGYYFSTDAKFDAKDTLMLQKPLKGGLKGKTNRDVDDKVAIPVSAKPGPAYVIVKVDNKNEVKESQELNNTALEAVNVIKLCLADAQEPNGTPTIAKPLFTGTMADLSLCPYEFDWYGFEAKKGETITLTAKFTHKNGDLDMRLYEVGKFGKAVATSATKGDPEQIVFTAPKTTKYFVRINGFAGASNVYSLSFCKKTGGACVDCTADLHCAGAGAFCGEGGNCKLLGCTVGDDKTCNNGNSCTVDMCVAKKGCTHTPVKAGTECGDADLCTLGESCSDKGVCTAPTAQSVKKDAWLSGGRAGQLIHAAGKQLFVGSAADGKGAVTARAELYDRGTAIWGKDLSAAGYNAAHLASAASQTATGAIISVGWLRKDDAAANLPTSATLTLPQSAVADAAWMVRLDGATGKVLGSKTWAGNHGFHAVVDAGKGNVVAVGFKSTTNKSTATEAWAAQIDGAGKIQWEVLLGGTLDDRFMDVIAAPIGGWYAVGIDATASGTAGLLAYIDAAGKLVWSKTYAGAKGGAKFYAVTSTGGGDLVCVGSSDEGAKSLQGWAAWLTGATAKAAPNITGAAAFPGTTPQDAGYKGATTAWFTDVVAGGDKSLTIAGTTGATAAKGGLDAAIWSIGTDKKVKKLWTWGGAGNDVMNSVLTSLGQIRTFGTLLADNPTASQWYETLVSPPKANCDDFNPCTTDACSAKTGCGHTPVKDGTSCGTGLTCTSGVCK